MTLSHVKKRHFSSTFALENSKQNEGSIAQTENTLFASHRAGFAPSRLQH